MPLIPDGVIDEVQSRADIAELIGRYVPLKRTGRHFKTHCPFHKERTPSFVVNTDKQIFHCFGCGVGGNVFSFLMQHDRLTFPEAVRQLADHVGVCIPDRGELSANGAHERLMALTEKICRYFERLLRAPEQGKAARAYLQQRGVSEPTWHAFRLGFAPAGWDRLLSAATRTGVAAEDLEAVGLVVKGHSGHYDRFRSRLIFPILDVRGRVVGFGGRSLDGQEPKYLNSPETGLYTKGRHLFGLAQAKDAIVTKKTAIVVEGYFDCIVLADAGLSHVVAPLGTALTIDQARLLRRYAERVILAFDADAAGEQATLRGIDLLVELGLHIHVAQLPTGVDPDDCLRSYGRARFDHVLEQSMNLFDFLIQSALHRYPAEDAENKVKAAQFILPTIAKVPSAMLRSEYVRLLAERLHLDEGAVGQELAKTQPRAHNLQSGVGQHASTVTEAIRSGAVVPQGPEWLLTALVLDDPARMATVQQHLSLDEVTDPSLRQILRIICELDSRAHSATTAQVISRLSDTGQGSLVTALVELAQSVAAKAQALEDCIRRVQANTRKHHLKQLQEQIRIAQDSGNERTMQHLLTEYQQVVSQPQGG